MNEFTIRMTIRRLLGIMVMLAGATHASAHHAFSPMYDENRVVTIDGVVTEFKFVNPHALMTVEVKDSAGAARRWVVEFASRQHLAENGWTENTIKSGQRVSITGNPSWGSAPRLFLRRLNRATETADK